MVLIFSHLVITKNIIPKYTFNIAIKFRRKILALNLQYFFSVIFRKLILHNEFIYK